jgi:hypothetical protein
VFIYFLTLVVVVVAVAISERLKEPVPARVFMVAAIAWLIVVAGIRERTVGTDTAQYIKVFESGETLYDAIIVRGERFELGYLILSSFARSISQDQWSLLFATAAIVIVCNFVAIYQWSRGPTIAIFVFITMGYYTAFFNVARQGIAVAVFSLAIGSMLNGNFRRYCLIVLAAIFFHRSAILAIPAYFIIRRKSTPLFWLVASFFSGVAILLFDRILVWGSQITEKYTVYVEAAEGGGGEYLTLFYGVIFIFFAFYRQQIPESDRKEYDCFLNMSLLAAALCIAIVASGAAISLMRLATYFQIATVYLWPRVFRSIKDTRTRIYFGVIVGLCHLVFFALILQQGEVVPYEINTSLIRSIKFLF